MLKEVVQIYGGGTPSKARPDFYRGSIPWVSPKDFRHSDIFDTEDHITEEALENSATRLIPAESVLVVVRSGVLKHRLPVAINRVPVAVNQDVKAFICNRELNARYLAHNLRYQAPKILQRVRGTTADNIPLDVFKDLPIFLPGKPEQDRIAAVLDRAEAVRLSILERSKTARSLLKSAFYSFFGDPVKNDRGWPVARLADHLSFMTSGSRGWAKYYSSAGAKFLRIQNVGRDELLLSEVAYVEPPDSAEARRTKVEPEDVLLSVTADLGRTAVIPKGFGTAYINQHLVILRCKGVDPVYLSAYLQTPAGQQQFVVLNRDAVKAGLNFDDIRGLQMLLPPAAVQSAFRVASECIRATLMRSRQAEQEALNLTASLQQNVFGGQNA
ncbi:MAG: restriction endonuclease subunit S [Fimbriimonadaceae bacterium]|nr:restriction endonuclease subunit S [Fimbriimonadaceae bacterium]